MVNREFPTRFTLRVVLAAIMLVGGCARPTPTATPIPLAPTPAPPVTLETTYEYDPAGNLVAHTDPNGATIRYEYDAENRLTRILYPDGSQVAYTYDANGHRTRMTDGIGTTLYEYDLHGRLIRVTHANGNAMEYKYDAVGNLTDLIYPDGSVVHYDYDADGLLTRVTDATSTTRYTYDDAGKLVSRTLPNSISTHYTYDAANRLVGITHINHADQILLAFEYTLDAAGRCIQVVESRADGQHLITRYAYDSLSRLTEVVYPNGQAVQYTYDVMGNRLTMTTSEGKTTYTYDQANRLVSLTEPDGSITTFTYDANGNLTERRSPEGTTLYTYDYENRLVRVEDGTTVVEFVYDGDGNRVAKIVNGVRTDYITNINSLLPQILLERTVGKGVRYILGDRLLAQTDVATGETLYLLEDRLGSTVALADKNGTLLATLQYDAFGAVSPTGNVESHYGFTGERYDQETGLLYLRARYYDPAIGRFISKDPFPGFLWDPQSQNGYAYAGNNPVNLVDPSGLQPPYPYGRDRYDRMPVYTGPRWSRPSEWSISTPEPYYSGLKASEERYRYLAWVWFREYAWTDVLRTIVGELAPEPEWESFTFHTFRGDITVIIPAYRSIAEAVGYGVRSGSTIAATIVGSYLLRPDISYEAFLIEQLPGYPIEEFVQRERRLKREVERWNWYFGGPCIHCFDDGDGGGGPSVGGVSLDKTAEVLVNLNDITGAALDPNTGQIILIGRKDLTLPPMNLDDLVVAIRSVYAGKDPGVTMVPVDPSGKDPTQRVEYFGATEGTRFGWIMFEADRYLKSLAAGKDSLTGEPVIPSVPGFKSELQLSFERRTNVPWHRNWFVPDEIVLKQSEDGKSMIFERATMRVESRFVKFLEDGTTVDIPGNSPVTDQFTRFLTEHYDELAREKPELAELVRLAKIVGLVRWLRDNDIPVDLSWIGDYQVEAVETPKTTPGVSARMCTADGAYCIVSLGGVDFSTENTYKNDDGKVAALRDRALASRPDALPMSWDFEQDGQAYTAVALNLAPAQVIGGYSAVVRDLGVRVNGGLTVNFTRYYNSLNLKDGPMGPGWSFIPYALHIQGIPKPAKETEWGRKGYRIEQRIALMTGIGREAFTGPYADSNGQRFFLPERPSTAYRDILIHDDGTYTLRRRDRIRVHFDASGRIYAIEDENGNRFVYRYDERGRLAAIVDGVGRGVTLSYNKEGHLIRVTASDGRIVFYEYDINGRLVSVSDNFGPIVSYVYDADDHLIEIQDCQGQTLLQNRYDELGRLLSQTTGAGYHVTTVYDPTTNQVTYIDPTGNRFLRAYENDRLVRQIDPRGNSICYGYENTGNLTSITDERGNTTLYRYDESGNLSWIQSPSGATTRIFYDSESRPIWVINPENAMTMFRYDERGNLAQVTSGLKVTSLNPDGSVRYDASQAYTTTFTYDGRGYLVAATDARGNTIRMEYDERGNITSVRMPGGSVTQMEYDGRSRLTSITDPLGYTLRFGYDERDQLLYIATAAGTISYEYDHHGNMICMRDPLGNATRYERDPGGRLISVIEPTGAVTRYKYDAIGNMLSVVYPNGAQRQYEYDAMGQLIREIYTFNGHNLSFRAK